MGDALKDVEDAIEAVYREAYGAYRDRKVRDLPRLNPDTGLLGVLWKQFDSLVGRE